MLRRLGPEDRGAWLDLKQVSIELHRPWEPWPESGYRPPDANDFQSQLGRDAYLMIRRADNLVRRVIGRVYHRAVSLMFGLKIRDTDCDFRLIRRETLERIHLEHTSGVICVELVRKLQDAGARFVEVPVDHPIRVRPRSR